MKKLFLILPLFSITYTIDIDQQLIEAANIGNTTYVQHLLATGAHTNPIGMYNSTPLHKAVAGNYTEIAKLLLAAGAKIDVKDMSGRTPLQDAASQSHGKNEIVELLLAAAANPNATDNLGRTPLHLAAHYGRAQTARLLLSAGAHPNITDLSGKTPLQLAEQYNKIETVKALQQYDNLNETVATNPSKELFNKLIAQGYTLLAKKLLLKLQLTPQQLTVYNQLLQDKYTQTGYYAYKALAQELRDYAVGLVRLTKLLTGDTANNQHSLPKEIIPLIATFAQ